MFRSAFLVVIFISLICCRKTSVEKEERQCLISSYVTDTVDNGTSYRMVYDGNRITEIHSSFPGYFVDEPVKLVSKVAYDADGNPLESAVTSSGYKATYQYSIAKMLEHVNYFERSIYPRAKASFEWTNGRVSKITWYYYEIKGSKNDVANYTAKVNYVLMPVYDAVGNISSVTTMDASGTALAKLEFSYDTHINPFKNLCLLLGGFDPERVHMLSVNNMTEVKYTFFPSNHTETHSARIGYDANGYPTNGSFGTRMFNIKYECR